MDKSKRKNFPIEFQYILGTRERNTSPKCENKAAPDESLALAAIRMQENGCDLAGETMLAAVEEV